MYPAIFMATRPHNGTREQDSPAVTAVKSVCVFTEYCPWPEAATGWHIIIIAVRIFVSTGQV